MSSVWYLVSSFFFSVCEVRVIHPAPVKDFISFTFPLKNFNHRSAWSQLHSPLCLFFLILFLPGFHIIHLYTCFLYYLYLFFILSINIPVSFIFSIPGFHIIHLYTYFFITPAWFSYDPSIYLQFLYYLYLVLTSSIFLSSFHVISPPGIPFLHLSTWLSFYPAIPSLAPRIIPIPGCFSNQLSLYLVLRLPPRYLNCLLGLNYPLFFLFAAIIRTVSTSVLFSSLLPPLLLLFLCVFSSSWSSSYSSPSSSCSVISLSLQPFISLISNPVSPLYSPFLFPLTV